MGLGSELSLSGGNSSEIDKSIKARLGYFLNPFDARFEDLKKGNLALNIFRDFTAGLIVAMVAIPLAMGFAMASGLRPEQGIVGGAIAGLIGALFGGSKYQVYGPTAAFIPLIATIMAQYDFSFLVMASIAAGGVLCLLGVGGFGRLAKLVPHSIIVGFTIGIALVIATSQIGEVLGLKHSMGTSFLQKLKVISNHLSEINIYSVAIAGLTFLCTKHLLKVSVYIPAPLIAIGVGTLLSSMIWADKGLTLIQDKYGKIPTDFWVFTPPSFSSLSPSMMGDLAYFAVAIVFVSAVESVLCSRMADRLANNQGVPFHPSKELFGQGMVNIVIPLFNGFPHTGALARTATNIKVGAMSPLAGIFKCVLKLMIAAYLATYLELVPMACLGGILLYVATVMVKPAEVKEVFALNYFHVGLMIWTASVVLFSDFLTGVLSGLAIYGFASWKFPKLNEVRPSRKEAITGLLKGVLRFRARTLPAYRDTFARLASEQKPKAAFVACSDSRVVPDLLASTRPGDIFVIRNVGNLIPPFPVSASPQQNNREAEAAALDFALEQLGVKEIIVKGHSNCGAMKAILSGHIKSPALQHWLKYAETSLARFLSGAYQSDGLPDEDVLSQLNVMQQIENLHSYPLVREKVEQGELSIHGWWFDIKTASIFSYDPKEFKFSLIDNKLVRRVSKENSKNAFTRWGPLVIHQQGVSR